ncbi:MAG: PLP-dependent aminotransferase family protein [Thermovirga sp.]
MTARIELDRGSATPIFLQIVLALREQILTGTLPEGYPLPPERELARHLGVNRSTVVKAYQELKADGFLDARVGRGTIVTNSEPNDIRDAGKIEPIEWDPLFNAAPASSGDIFSEMMSTGGKDDVISFASGFPDPSLFPTDILSTLRQSLLSGDPQAPYMPSPVEGYAPLRESIAGLSATRGIEASSRNVMVLSGSMQGLDFAARSLLSPGDSVLTEDHTFFGAIDNFHTAGARIIGIPTDSDGMRTDLLEAAIRRHNPRLIYTLPTFQNPSGATMSLERRHELLATAGCFGVPVLEDDPYGDLRYEGSRLPPLKSLDHRGNVIYLSSFSKALFLGLRIGWAIAPQPVMERFSRLKQMTDLHANTEAQMLLDLFLRGGHYAPHIETVRAAYRKKRDAMAESLSHHKARIGWEWELPQGGYYIWCRMPASLPMRTFISRAARHRVAFLPGEAFCPDGKGKEKRIRLNFTNVPLDSIEEGVRRLARAAEEALENVSRNTGAIDGKEPIV